MHMGAQTLLVAIVTIFVISYAAIALEHPIKVNKSASALLGAGLLWTVYAVLSGDYDLIGKQLDESVSSTAQIVFFLIGAMTIVEVIDAHNGFEVITSLISTRKQANLMWLVGFVTFFLSAILDNLTTTIVMISLMRKLLDNQNDRLLFAAMIVIAANAGGAWSAIGDVTTTMLWIGGQITPLSIMGSRDCSAPRTGGRAPASQHIRTQSNVLPGTRHPYNGASVQDHHSSTPVYGNTFWARHPLDGR